MTLSPTQELIAYALLTVLAFLLGVGIGSLDDPTDQPAEVRYVETPAGDFNDVPLSMTSSSGPTFNYLCDMHLTEEPNGDTAECEYQP